MFNGSFSLHIFSFLCIYLLQEWRRKSLTNANNADGFLHIMGDQHLLNIA